MSSNSENELSEVLEALRRSPAPESPPELDRRILDYAHLHAPRPDASKQPSWLAKFLRDLRQHPIWFTAAMAFSVTCLGVLVVMRSGDVPQSVPLEKQAGVPMIVQNEQQRATDAEERHKNKLPETTATREQSSTKYRQLSLVPEKTLDDQHADVVAEALPRNPQSRTGRQPARAETESLTGSSTPEEIDENATASELTLVNAVQDRKQEKPAVRSCYDLNGIEYQRRADAEIRKENYREAGRWSNMAVAICPTYESYRLLGEAEQKQSNLEAALAAYFKAQNLAVDTDAQATAIAHAADVRWLMGDNQEAWALIKKAKKYHSKEDPDWMLAIAAKIDSSIAEKRLRKDQVFLAMRGMSAVDSESSLTAANIKPVDSTAVSDKPSISLHLNFMGNSAELDRSSQQELPALAATLADDELADETFSLIGYTELQSTEGNDTELSKKRVEAIYSALIALEPDLRNRITTKMMGEPDPLLKENTEVNDWLSRRFEVVID